MQQRKLQFTGHDERRRRARRLSVIAILVVVSLLLSRCMYYDDGVRADHPGVRYPSRYAGTEDHPYQFYTTLYRADGTSGGGVEIEVQHLAQEPFKDFRESRITVQYDSPSRRLRVRPGSVRLEHRTVRGKRLEPSESRSSIGSCARQTSGCVETFSHVYRPPRSRRLQERIRLEYELDGRVHVIDTTFPLEYRYHYSWWDVMMGI
ncbi:hypothetical protein [Longimicrobium sp.]|uniref:hypothetical protein n=1 Tax=Longimicrobium sp. TaxID=2029185 RepID=UPI002E32F469|nr:hypothetical protein [Longimicrobium sp.]HEX6040082.1 hypothetical protein [Longimicrobium sp.]